MLQKGAQAGVLREEVAIAPLAACEREEGVGHEFLYDAVGPAGSAVVPGNPTKLRLGRRLATHVPATEAFTVGRVHRNFWNGSSQDAAEDPIRRSRGAHACIASIQTAMATIIRFSVSETKPSGTLLDPPTQAHLISRLST